MRRIMFVLIGLFFITITLAGCASVHVGAEGGRTYYSTQP
jgi:uncharacterized protein YceK